jgi:non-canonical (house-cleaning) NTP pyrophosphatase
MQRDLRAFWSRFQAGIEVAVASSAPDKLLGVRDGFLRCFHDGLGRPIPIAVVPHQDGNERLGLPMSDEETIQLARRRATELREELGATYHFYVGCEGGLHSLEVDGKMHYFVSSWTVIVGLGTRRKGGMTSSITGGLETRRSAVGVSTFNALSTVLYGILESHPLRRA